MVAGRAGPVRIRRDHRIARPDAGGEIAGPGFGPDRAGEERALGIFPTVGGGAGNGLGGVRRGAGDVGQFGAADHRRRVGERQVQLEVVATGDRYRLRETVKVRAGESHHLRAVHGGHRITARIRRDGEIVIAADRDVQAADALAGVVGLVAVQVIVRHAGHERLGAEPRAEIKGHELRPDVSDVGHAIVDVGDRVAAVQHPDADLPETGGMVVQPVAGRILHAPGAVAPVHLKARMAVHDRVGEGKDALAGGAERIARPRDAGAGGVDHVRRTGRAGLLVGLDAVGQHPLRMAPGGLGEARFQCQRGQGREGRQIRLQLRQIHLEKLVGRQRVGIQVAGGGEADAFGGRVGPRAVEELQVELLVVRGIADGILHGIARRRRAVRARGRVFELGHRRRGRHRIGRPQRGHAQQTGEQMSQCLHFNKRES